MEIGMRVLQEEDTLSYSSGNRQDPKLLAKSLAVQMTLFGRDWTWRRMSMERGHMDLPSIGVRKLWCP